MDPESLEVVYRRNVDLYGDPGGPSIDFLRSVSNKTWEQIIESATRTGGNDLGL
jgi:signal recognition particle receptor subunit beta